MSGQPKKVNIGKEKNGKVMTIGVVGKMMATTGEKSGKVMTIGEISMMLENGKIGDKRRRSRKRRN